MSKVIKLKKGLNIKLKGKADDVLKDAKASETYAIKPTDFDGLTPKLVVKVDDKVKAGSTLFYDKYRPEVQFTSPVSGQVVAIHRGERRRILEVVVKADKKIEYEQFIKANPKMLKREDIIKNLLDSGLWPFIRQRPYSIIANPEDKPKAIFVTGFDSAPLAPYFNFVVKGEEKSFQLGLDALKKLTDGEVHLNLHYKEKTKVFSEAKNVRINRFKGKHPAGNVGIQIHHLDPINKGDVAWCLSALDVILIGRLFDKGVYDATRRIALAGSEVEDPQYYKTMVGASIENIVRKNIKRDNVRYISGNVLTGTKIDKKGYLGFYDSMVSVIREGDFYEFLGWATPGIGKYSASRSFLSWLTPDKKYKLHTNLNGGERAFVMSGQYDNVLPMDILPVFLLKSIMAEDIEQMERLGIYEVAEEDFALCEFVCTSKMEVQELIRKGLNLMIKEMG